MLNWQFLPLLLVSVIPLHIQHHAFKVFSNRIVQQDQVDEIRRRAIRLNAAEPKLTKTSELLRLIKALDGVQMIQLGEQTHGDGSFFLHRTTLVKFLYEQMGFEVIAFDSGMFECDKVDFELGNSTNMADALEPGIYPVWRLSEQMQPFFEFIRETKNSSRPISLRGFDCQFSSDTTANRFFDLFTKLITVEQQSLMSSRDQKLLRDALDAIQRAGATKLDSSQHEAFGVLFDRMDQMVDAPQVRSRNSLLTRSRWHRWIDNLRSEETNIYFKSIGPRFTGDFDKIIRAPEIIVAGNARDESMSKNLQWLAEIEFPNQKIIVWAANNHVKYKGSLVAHKALNDGSVPRETRAGELVQKKFQDRVYTILAVCYEGEWSAPSLKQESGFRWQSGEFRPAVEGSFAELCKSTELGAFILDIRSMRDQPDHWIHSPWVIRQDFFEGQPQRLSDICDAVLFVEKLKPSCPIK